MHCIEKNSKYIPANISTVISNVPGPTVPLYSAGAKMVRYHAMGLLTPGCGAFHLIYSCNGLVTITVLADRETVPDPEFYRQCLEQSFAETLAAIPGDTRARAITPKKRARKAATSRSNTRRSQGGRSKQS